MATRLLSAFESCWFLKSGHVVLLLRIVLNGEIRLQGGAINPTSDVRAGQNVATFHKVV